MQMCIRDRITVLPEQLQSPLLTAEWEYRLGEIEHGQLAPEEFLDGIRDVSKRQIRHTLRIVNIIYREFNHKSRTFISLITCNLRSCQPCKLCII